MREVDALLRLAGAGTVLATLMSFAARLWWGFELMTHFRLQLLVAALVLAAALQWRRRGLFALALAAAAAVNAVPLARYVRVPPSSAAEAGTLDVLSVNVRWRNDRDAGLLDVVARQAPDVVVVVELTPAWRERLRPLDERYPHRLLAPRPDPFGVGLWSRYPLRAAALTLESASAVDADIATPAGTLRLLGVHLRAPTTHARAVERNRQLAELAELTRSAQGPLLVAGDFNTTAYSPYFADWLAASDLRDVRDGLHATWPTFLPILGIPIDHCVVNVWIEAASIRRLRAFGSDHYPILCRLTLKQPSTSTR